jgi:hypothetical protein
MVISKSRNVGLFAEITTTIRHIKVIKEGNKKVFVDWNSGNSLYYDKRYGQNVWEYYFDKIDGDFDNNVEGVFDNYIEMLPHDNLNIRETFNYIYNKYIKLNESTQRIIDENIKIVNNKTLGVHIRKTDKFFGVQFNEPMAIPVDDQLVMKLIDGQLEKYDSLFIATDCEDTYEIFKKRYSDKIISNDNRIRGRGNNAPHTSDRNNGYEKGLECLIDCYILSNCGFLIRSTSNVSSFSMFLNLDLECININEIYRNDTREHEFNIVSKI